MTLKCIPSPIDSGWGPTCIPEGDPCAHGSVSGIYGGKFILIFFFRAGIQLKNVNKLITGFVIN